MPQKGNKPEEIFGKLREAELMINQGATVAEACRKIYASKLTHYRWRKEYGGLRVDQAQRMKQLEKENGRLKKLVADLSLDNQTLKEAASGNF